MSTTKSVIDVNGIRYELAHLLGRALSANMTETPGSFGITVGRWR